MRILKKEKKNDVLYTCIQSFSVVYLFTLSCRFLASHCQMSIVKNFAVVGFLERTWRLFAFSRFNVMSFCLKVASFCVEKTTYLSVFKVSFIIYAWCRQTTYSICFWSFLSYVRGNDIPFFVFLPLKFAVV